MHNFALVCVRKTIHNGVEESERNREEEYLTTVEWYDVHLCVL